MRAHAIYSRAQASPIHEPKQTRADGGQTGPAIGTGTGESSQNRTQCEFAGFESVS